MRSLAERHEDRAARKAANRAETVDGSANSVATVETMFRDAIAAQARLSDDEKRELDESLRAASEAGELGLSTRSLAEAPDGSGDTMAGIGVVNTNVVPGATLASAEAGNGGGSAADAGWGSIQPVTEAPLEPAPATDGNAAGASLVEQGVVDPAKTKATKAK